MKYYAVCDVVDNYKYEIRTEQVVVDNGKYDTYTRKAVIFQDELEALRECNDVNLNREKPICVVVEMEV